jgi:hypothetical protein
MLKCWLKVNILSVVLDWLVLMAARDSPLLIRPLIPRDSFIRVERTNHRRRRSS